MQFLTFYSCFRFGVAGYLSVLFAGTTELRGAVISSTFVNPANGHTYHHVVGTVSTENPTGGLSWTEADNFVDSLGVNEGVAHLVSISNPEEEQWIRATFLAPHMDFLSNLNLFWTGLTDRQAEGVYSWENGEQATYLNWTGGHPPIDLSGNEDFVYFTNTTIFEGLTDSGQLNDHTDNRDLGGIPMSAIIEVIPEPMTGLLLPLGLLGLLRRRRI